MSRKSKTKGWGLPALTRSVKAETTVCRWGVWVVLFHALGGEGVFFMENKEEKRIAVVSILVTDRGVSERVNALLSEYGDWILGRMGIPYKEKQVSVLSVVLDAPVEITNALTGKLGRINGVLVKALFGKI